MFSKELAELDRNTVQYMIDEMQDQIDEQAHQLRIKDQKLGEMDQQLKEMDQKNEKHIRNMIQVLKAQQKSPSEIQQMLELVYGLTPEEAAQKCYDISSSES